MTGRVPAITIRPGTPREVPLIAQCALAAVGRYHYTEPMEEMSAALYHQLLDICTQRDTLYSYRHALIATLDDRPVGCLISYPGEEFAAGQHLTLAALEGERPGEGGAETGPGEYYLDSMALHPDARGYRIGLKLLQTATEHATEVLGYRRVTLLVDEAKPRLEAYYRQLDFRREESVELMGHLYHRMIRTR